VSILVLTIMGVVYQGHQQQEARKVREQEEQLAQMKRTMQRKPKPSGVRLGGTKPNPYQQASEERARKNGAMVGTEGLNESMLQGAASDR